MYFSGFPGVRNWTKKRSRSWSGSPDTSSTLWRRQSQRRKTSGPRFARATAGTWSSTSLTGAASARRCRSRRRRDPEEWISGARCFAIRKILPTTTSCLRSIENLFNTICSFLVLEFFSRFLNHNRHSETKKGFYFGKPSRSHLIGIRVLSQLSNKYINCMTKVSVDHEFFLIECRKYTLIYHRTKRTEARVSHLNRTHTFHNSDETLDQNEYQDLQPRARLGNDIEDKSLNLRVKCALHFVSLLFNKGLAKAHNESNLRNTRLNRTMYPALKTHLIFSKLKCIF